MTMKKITKKAVIVILGVSLWHSIAINKKYNNVSNELEMVMKSNNKLKIDSLLQEIMDIGWKNDSLTLKYEYGWEF
jgi:excinuclease UvrABC helicase subunit UvrB